MFFKACGIFEHFDFELPQIHEGCFEYRFKHWNCLCENNWTLSASFNFINLTLPNLIYIPWDLTLTEASRIMRIRQQNGPVQKITKRTDTCYPYRYIHTGYLFKPYPREPSIGNSWVNKETSSGEIFPHNWRLDPQFETLCWSHEKEQTSFQQTNPPCQTILKDLSGFVIFPAVWFSVFL